MATNKPTAGGLLLTFKTESIDGEKKPPTKKATVKESKIEEYLRLRIKGLGGKAYKFVSPGNAGVPDRLVCLPYGIKIFREMKAPGKKSTPLQVSQQNELKALGNDVDVIDTKQGVDEFIEYCKTLMERERFKKEALGCE